MQINRQVLNRRVADFLRSPGAGPVFCVATLGEEGVIQQIPWGIVKGAVTLSAAPRPSSGKKA
jgi:hypothetical protein